MDRSFISFVMRLFLIFCFSDKTFSYPVPVDFEGNLFRWDVSKEIPNIYFDMEAEEKAFENTLLEIVSESVSLWNSVPESFIKILPKNGDSKPVSISFYFGTDLENVASVSGYSLFDRYDDSKPLHCQIRVFVDSSITIEEVAKTTLHEIGHCLGLGHSLIATSIMGYSWNENGFWLDIDDRAAVSNLYPSDGSAPKLPMGCSVLLNDRDKKTPWGGFFFLFGLIVLLF